MLKSKLLFNLKSYIRAYVTALKRQSTTSNHFGMGMINKMSTKAFPSKDEIHRFQKGKLAGKEATPMAAIQVVSVEDEKEASDE